MGLTPAEMNQRTLQILLRQGLLTAEMAETVWQQATRRRLWAGQVAVEARHLSDRSLATGLAQQFDLPLVELSRITPDFTALACLTRDFCRRHQVVPIALERDVLRLAVANPLQEIHADALPKPRTFAIDMHLAPLLEIRDAIERWYSLPLPPAVPAATPSAKSARPKTVAPALLPVSRHVVIAEVSAGEFVSQLHDLLAAMLENCGTDLHLSVGLRPLMRVQGALQPLPFPQLDASLLRHMVYAILSDVQVAVFEARSELDLAYRVPDGVRFRVNVFRQRGEVGAVFRLIPAEIPALHSLGLPASVLQLTRKNCGLVLVTGPASSGKSTLLAAMLEEINHSRKAHIITIEDPVEFVFRPKNSEINQRQVGTDTENYVVALRQALRQDPDVILVDKLPDRETIAAAIAAAETGHLVFASLPTLGAVPTLQHLIHAFPVPMHLQMCERLANVVEGILTQVLVPGEAGEMACAREILIATPAVRARIQAGKLAQLPALMRNGKEGMTLLTQSFRQLRQRHNGGRMAFPDLRTLLETSRGDHHAA